MRLFSAGEVNFDFEAIPPFSPLAGHTVFVAYASRRPQVSVTHIFTHLENGDRSRATANRPFYDVNCGAASVATDVRRPTLTPSSDFKRKAISTASDVGRPIILLACITSSVKGGATSSVASPLLCPSNAGLYL